MLLQCSLGMVVMFIPSLLQKKLSLTIPNYMFVLYFIFLFCAIYLGGGSRFLFYHPILGPAAAYLQRGNAWIARIYACIAAKQQ